jgi:23S rRNA (guanosine2251-2'-O)-methyltransferase
VENQQRTDIIFGKNAVKEALKSGRPIDYVLVAKGEEKSSLAPIVAQCRKLGLLVKEADAKKLDFVCSHANHQGVVLFVAAKEYCGIDDIFAFAGERGEPPFFVLCDSLEDPHNLGAVVRTAEAAGVHGIILPERRSASLSGIVSKISAGALEYMRVAKVGNINAAIETLKKRGVWIYAADMDGTPYDQVDFSGPAALIIGSEGKGVSRLAREHADVIVSIPMHGKINSLNASVAGGILMFAMAKRRGET